MRTHLDAFVGQDLQHSEEPDKAHNAHGARCGAGGAVKLGAYLHRRVRGAAGSQRISRRELAAAARGLRLGSLRRSG